MQYIVSSSSYSTRIGFLRVPIGLERDGVVCRDECGCWGLGDREGISGKTMAAIGVGRRRTDGTGSGEGVRRYGGNGSLLSDRGESDCKAVCVISSPSSSSKPIRSICS